MQALTTTHLVPGRSMIGDRFYTRRASASNTTCESPQLAQQDACAALTGTTLFAQVLTEGDIASGDRLLVLDEV